MARVSKVITKKVKRGKSPSIPLKHKGEDKKKAEKAEKQQKSSIKMTITPKTQGQRLRAFIELAGLTIKEFSLRTGVPYSTLKRVVKGTTRLNEEHIEKVKHSTNVFIPSLLQEKTKLFCWPVVARRRAA